MIVHAFTIVRNDKFMLRYFLRHYSTFCQYIHVIDEWSEDGTKELIREYETQVIHLHMDTGGIDDDKFNEIWQELPMTFSLGKADYVITVDCDEFVFGDFSCLDADLVFTEGYQMIAEKMPTTDGQIYEEIKEGISDNMHNKPIIRKPHVKLKYSHGRHSCNVISPHCSTDNSGRIKLLHFRFIDREYVKKRHERNWSRICEASKKVGSGVHTRPGYDGYSSLKWYDEALRQKRRLPFL